MFTTDDVNSHVDLTSHAKPGVEETAPSLREGTKSILCFFPTWRSEIPTSTLVECGIKSEITRIGIQISDVTALSRAQTEHLRCISVSHNSDLELNSVCVILRSV